MPIGMSCKMGCAWSFIMSSPSMGQSLQVIARPPLIVTTEQQGLAALVTATQSVPWCVELALDPGPDVTGPLDLRQTLLKHELGHPSGRRRFGLQNVRLGRKQHSQLQLFRCHLIGCGLSG